MKKGIIVLLIAVLAAGFAFAGFSGDAYIQFNADIDEETFGFANGTDVDFTFEFDSEEVKLVGEEKVHVEVAASAKLLMEYGAGGATQVYTTNGDTLDFGVVYKISKARIAGENWYVDILGVKSSYDYAKAAALKVKTKKVNDSFGNTIYKTNQAASYSIAYKKAPGFTIGYDGFTASFGFLKDSTGTAVSATLETKAFKFSEDAISVQAAAEVSKEAGKPVNAGASFKTTVAMDKIEAGVAADFGLGNLMNDDVDPYFAMDARADFKYDFVNANVYMFYTNDETDTAKLATSSSSVAGAYRGFYMEAKAAFDLNSFEVPLSVTLTGKNLVDVQEDAVGAAAGIDLGASVDYAQDAIAAGVSFGFNTESKAWSGNLYGTYAAEKFTAGANVALSGADELSKFGLGAFVESDAIVNGATFGLNYGYNNTSAMYYGGSYVASNADNTNNFAADEAEIGTIGAYCMIAF